MEISLLVILDNSNKENYRVYQKTILPFLEHFGVPCREIDLAKEESTNFNASGILIAQEGLGERMSKETKESLYQALKQGTGLINLDYHLDSWKELHQPLKIERIEKENKTSLVRIGETHYINQLQQPEAEKELLQPLEFLRVKTEGEPLLLSEDNSPLLLCSPSLKLVQFLISPKLWDEEYFGHCTGLDDILFRSIIWAVKKPFVAKMIPPFVTSRIDDANGSANIFGKKKDSANKNFAYLNILNKYGYVPNVGLYIDDITEEDRGIIKEKYAKHLANFSPHAFSDPKNINEHPIYMLHNGKEFSVRELKENFSRVDERFEHWKIRQSKTINAHFGEVGVKSLPFLRERGIGFTMQPGVPFGYNWAGAVEGKHPEWNPKPYGNHGFNYDEMLNRPEFFNVVSHFLGSHKLKDGGISATDFLWGNTTFWNESKFNNIDGAAEGGAKTIKLGLDSGFLGCLMTHEQRIATLSAKEFEETLKRIDDLLSDREKIFASYDKIAEYLYHHSQSELKEVKIEGNKISCRLSGKSAIPLKLSIFEEKEGKIIRKFHNLPSFSEEVKVESKM